MTTDLGRSMSEGEEQQVLQFLSELDALRERDPIAFREQIEALETNLNQDAPRFESFQNLADSIKEMKNNTNQETSNISVDLPGGTATLGSQGVESKVVYFNLYSYFMSDRTLSSRKKE